MMELVLQLFFDYSVDVTRCHYYQWCMITRRLFKTRNRNG